METTTKNLDEAGIYKLTCKNNGKIYIGKSVNIARRLKEHKLCGTKTVGKYFFQNVIIKHGWESFEVEILEKFEDFDKLRDNSTLLKRETYYINLFDSSNREKGYNICKESTDKTGIPHSEETKEKIRQANLGKKLSTETKKKISESKLGKPYNLSEENRLKRKAPKSEETKERMRNSRKLKSIKTKI